MEMANTNRVAIAKVLGLSELLDLDHIKTAPFFAYRECKLSPHNGFSFDGASRVDVVLWVQPKRAVALELKLGKTGLTKSKIDNEFLQPCRPSHHQTRLAGNMMAILDRRFGCHAPEDGLNVEIEGSAIPLFRKWVLITHQVVLDRWIDDAKPSFSQHTNLRSIQKVVRDFGGEKPFNDVVTNQLALNYYEAWIA